MAGAGVREYKRRIRSVKNMQQITKAMKMVAAAKLRRAQENPEYLKAMEEAGYEVDYMEGQEYEDYMKAMEAVVIEYADELGYN